MILLLVVLILLTFSVGPQFYKHARQVCNNLVKKHFQIFIRYCLAQNVSIESFKDKNRSVVLSIHIVDAFVLLQLLLPASISVPSATPIY